METIKLHRSVHERMRYYMIILHPTLFGEYLLERRYGSMQNKNSTGVLLEYFSSYISAKEQIDKICELKTKKGYSKITSE